MDCGEQAGSTECSPLLCQVFLIQGRDTLPDANCPIETYRQKLIELVSCAGKVEPSPPHTLHVRSLGKCDQRDPKFRGGCRHLALAVLGVLIALLLLLQLLGNGRGELGVAPLLRLEGGLEAVCRDPEEGVGLEAVQLVEEDVETGNKQCQWELHQIDPML